MVIGQFGVEKERNANVVAELKACAKQRNLHKGTELHAHILQKGLIQKRFVASALINMYGKCGALSKAAGVLDELPYQDVISWNALIAGFIEQGYDEEALKNFKRMQQEGVSPNTVTYVSILKACGSVGAVDKGELVHNDIVRQGLLGTDAVLGSCLVDMYARCGALEKAARVLYDLSDRDVVSWTALISGYVQQGRCQDALKVFDCMQTEGISPNPITYTCILKACSGVEAVDIGKQIHEHIIKQDLLEKNLLLGTALVDMYAGCGELEKAENVLTELPVQNVASWNALLSRYVQKDEFEKALECFERMQLKGPSPDAVSFVCILNACCSTVAVNKGKQIHKIIAMQGLLAKDVAVGNSLVHMYAKCGALVKALEVLDELPVRNVVSWGALIAGYCRKQQNKEALQCFGQMQSEGIISNEVIFISTLQACGNLGATKQGEWIHKEVLRQGLLGKHILLDTAVMNMYAKCGALAKAAQVFDDLPARDIVSWSALILGYVEQGLGNEALKCFERLQGEGIQPNSVTFISILKACGSIVAADKGKQVHHEIVRQGLLMQDVKIGTALVDMYARCGEFSEAMQLLDELPIRDVVCWNALLTGYSQYGQSERAVECFQQMQSEGIFPDIVSFTCILKACDSIGEAKKAKQVHNEILNQGLLANNVVLSSTVVGMFAKCGALAKAAQVFAKLCVQDVASWNALITGYIQHGEDEEALRCYDWMQFEGHSPDTVTFICSLKACGNIGAVNKAEQIHDAIMRQGLLERDIVLGNTLAYMYVKCGALVNAARVLEGLPFRNVVSWNTLLGGYAKQGWGKEALICFKWMQQEGLAPDPVTFSCVLSACNHSALLHDGQMSFANMSLKYGITPFVEHYTYMVDFFCHAGEFNKAVVEIKKMPYSVQFPVWNTLLGACQSYGNFQFARLAFDNLVQWHSYHHCSEN